MLQTEDDVICIINEGQEGRFLNFHNTVHTANAYRQKTDKLMFKSVISTVR